MRRPIVIAAMAGAMALAAAGCSSASSPPAGLGLSALPPASTSTTAAAATPTTAAATTTCTNDTATTTGNATASLRPTGPLPTPGSPMTGFMATIQKRGRLVVGVDQNTYGMGFVNPSTGHFEGFDIDMLRQVAQAIFGNKPDDIQFKAITSAQRIPAVQSGDVDLVARTMTITCARWQQVDFSTEYYHAGQKVLVPGDSPVKTIADLGGKKVCATAGSTSIDTIKAQPSHPVPVAVTDWTDCLVDLQQQTVAAISTDDPILAGLARQDPNVKVVGPYITAEPYGMAMRKDHPEFVQFVNGVLDQMRADGRWTQIYNTWLGGLGPAPAPPSALYQP